MKKNGVTINKTWKDISLKSKIILEGCFEVKYNNCSVQTIICYFILKTIGIFAIIDFEGKNMLRYSGSFVPTKDMINAIKYCERRLKV